MRERERRGAVDPVAPRQKGASRGKRRRKKRRRREITSEKRKSNRAKERRREKESASEGPAACLAGRRFFRVRASSETKRLHSVRHLPLAEKAARRGLPRHNRPIERVIGSPHATLIPRPALSSSTRSAPVNRVTVVWVLVCSVVVGELAAGSASEDLSSSFAVPSQSSRPTDHGIVQELCKFASTRCSPSRSRSDLASRRSSVNRRHRGGEEKGENNDE